ncbi:peptidyl-prolyl cis-trans isomerase [Lutibacter sp. B1]|uniref:peptidyl-prolyl cis-trans isomerase n=1 Tax=Lutibacter sp. B1 TaxID=2725996 RepID=UPI0014567B52|nr:peptidyl-prolyl cis-trans isomerase [Lutibacter sp. B1]NLP57937.1 peptidyl-prolyl cis-trans isomerase [Lutibacter sp. B1]
MKKIFYYITALLLLQSCDYFTIKSDTREPVARVNDTYLYKDDLKNIFTKGATQQDSILLTKSYINNWIKQQLLLDKAQINLENKSVEFEGLVKKYREDLYINSYKEAVVKQYLDTVITSNDIDKFYSENGNNFKLNEELVKLRYIKIGKNVLNQKELIKLFKSSKKEDMDSLKAKELFLKSHHLNDSIWVKYSDLIAEIPIFKTIDKNDLLKKENFIQKEDSLSLYLVTVKQVLQRNEIAPKSYITPTIKQMILHQRKLLLLRNIEETLIDDANKKEQFEIY